MWPGGMRVRRFNDLTGLLLQLLQYFRYPNMKTIRELIYKRGYAKVNKRRIPITDNKVIEETLGE